MHETVRATYSILESVPMSLAPLNPRDKHLALRQPKGLPMWKETPIHVRAKSLQLRSRQQEKGCWAVLSQTKGRKTPPAWAKSYEGISREILRTEKLQKASREAQILCGLQGRAPKTFGEHKKEGSQARCGLCL